MIDKSRIYKHTMFAAGSLIAFAIILLLVSRKLMEFNLINGVSLLFLVFLVGTIGGIANTYRRIASLSGESEITATEPQARIMILQVYMSCLFGGVFAIVAYALLMTGIVKGALVPDFDGLGTVYSDVISFFRSIRPSTSLDAVKCLLWAFVAGFAEKWIPNMLDRLASLEEGDDDAISRTTRSCGDHVKALAGAEQDCTERCEIPSHRLNGV